MENLIKKYTGNIKGAIGETLIKELFIENNFIVYDYGVEHLVPSFSPRIGKKEFDDECHNSKVIKSLPDFVVSKEGRAEYVEVKFISDGFVNFKKEYSFKQAFVINVKKEGIYMAIAKDVITNGTKAYERIANFNYFKLSADSINAAEKVASKYFID